MLLTRWRCSYPPQVNTASCQTFLGSLDINTAWRSWRCVEELTVLTPGPPASPWPRGPGRQQLHSESRGFTLYTLQINMCNCIICNKSNQYWQDRNFSFSSLCILLIIILIIRAGHSSWASPSGMILLGGPYSPRTSEKIQDLNGTSTYSFDLVYDAT